jgi:histidinol-phosphate aminotransferase
VTDPVSTMRPALAGLTPMARPAPAPPGRNAPMRRMHYNEGAWAPSPRVTEALAKAIGDGGLNRYFEGYWGALAEAVARRHGVGVERVVCGNGSGELIQHAAMAFLEPGRNQVLSWPTFPRLRGSATMMGAASKIVPVTQDGAHDVDALVGAVDDATHLVWLATPNNPTGAACSAEEILRLARALPERIVLGIDEAYWEFAAASAADPAAAADAIAALEGLARSWLVLRTFSKAYGLAALRIGYAVCSDAGVAEALHRVRLTFNVAGLSQVAATAALADPDYMWRQVRGCVAERERLCAGLAKLGLACLPSAANFLAVRLPIEGKEAQARLKERGILVSAIGAPGYEHFIRVTISIADDNDAFLEALGRALPSAV